jgi:hypothetical protein
VRAASATAAGVEPSPLEIPEQQLHALRVPFGAS